MKKSMLKIFANNEEVESAIDGYFEELESSHYKHGVEVLHPTLNSRNNLNFVKFSIKSVIILSMYSVTKQAYIPN